MKKFIFYTFEGYTESPTGLPVENLQVLGFECGKSSIDAQNALISKNKWIIESGFDKNNIIARQLV